MEPMTVLVLAFQVLSLFSIAGALLVYLICKVRDDTDASNAEQHPGTVLITSADTALGLQLCTHLATKGCRVFAGMKDAHESLPAKLLNGWLRAREYNEEPIRGSIIPLQLDVTREDVLREALVTIGAHLNAEERGISAVINTSGILYRGRFETQDALQWEHMLKTNILGSLRIAKTFTGFLRHTRGRIIYLGAGAGKDDKGEGLVAYNASKIAVDKCAEELRVELQPYGIRVVALDTSGFTPESLYKPPDAQHDPENRDAPTQYSAAVLNGSSLHVIERSLWDMHPENRYQLAAPNGKCSFLQPCRSSLRMIRNTNATGAVHRV